MARIAAHYASQGDIAAIGCISNAVYDRFTLTSRGGLEYLGSRSSGNAVFHTAIDRLVSKIILKGMQRSKRAVRLLEETLEMDFMFSIDAPQEKGSKVPPLQRLVDRRKLKSGASIADFLSVSDRRTVVELLGRQVRFSSLKLDQVASLQKFMDLNPEVRVFVHRRNPARQTIDFGALSTGEQNRALTFAKVLSVAEEGALILIDEPEISLHLHWQMDFHRSLKGLLEGLKRIHVVVATHSPVIISEGAKHDSDDAAVIAIDHVDDGEGGERLIVTDRLFRDIASHERLVLDDFNTATYRTQEVDLKIAESVLEAVENPDRIADVIKRLQQICAKLGISEEDRHHVETAVRVVRKQALVLDTGAQS
ncbi:AAA family ATPase [Trinickia fusca]|uniref:AAA family ATPase n=1 Tax=Trinickia fusca TaxID=2419777 RepID=UPI00160274A5|nr:AAA family ATPase [Trinickia fusca]